mgnify:CR=1 FL=1|jgi:hypothetical protein
MVTVIVAEEATFHHTETPAGTITRNRSQRVSVRWSLPRLNSPDLLFTFEESDREVLSSLTANQLRLVAKTTEKDITTHSEVEALLLPAKKKPKKTTKPKTKTTKTEPESSEKEE